MDIVFLIPEKLLAHLCNHPKLCDVFKHIDHERYTAMMVQIISEIMQDIHTSYDHFTMMHISNEQCEAWMECFDKAMNEIEIDDQTKSNFSRKMKKVLDEMVRSPDICKFLSNVIEHSSNPRELIQHIKHYLDEFSISTSKEQ